MPMTKLLLALLLALTAPRGGAPQLALLTSTSGRDAQDRTVQGEVQNISGEPLKGIVVTATWYDKNKRVVSTNIGLLKDEPLEPNQRTAYTVSTRAKPAMDGYSVTFKFIRGGEIAVDDRRTNAR